MSFSSAAVRMRLPWILVSSDGRAAKQFTPLSKNVLEMPFATAEMPPGAARRSHGVASRCRKRHQ
jgi:hypothetical protein